MQILLSVGILEQQKQGALGIIILSPDYFRAVCELVGKKTMCNFFNKSVSLEA